MKKLIVLMFIGIVSQSFCMDQLPLAYGESESSSQDEVFSDVYTAEERVVVTNRFLDYFAHHELDAPSVESFNQTLDEVSHYVCNRVLMGAFQLELMECISFDIKPQGLALLADPGVEQGMVFAALSRLFQDSDHINMDTLDAQISRLSPIVLRYMYLLYYNNVRCLFEVLKCVVDGAKEDDDVRCRLVSRLRTLILQYGEITIRATDRLLREGRA